MDTENQRQFYCQQCDNPTTRAYAEVPLQLIVELKYDGRTTVTENPRCTGYDPSEIDLNKLNCMHCGNSVVLRTGEWKFVEDQHD